MEKICKVKNQKNCIICKKLFDCPPSSKKVTCSKECQRDYARIRSTGRKFSNESRKKLSEIAQGRDMSKLQKLATAAALSSPKSGRFETNINAKYWKLESPDGKIYYCRNLRNWARQNCELFGMDTSEKNVNTITSGLRQAKRGKYVATYKGWRIEEIKEADFHKRDSGVMKKQGAVI